MKRRFGPAPHCVLAACMVLASGLGICGEVELPADVQARLHVDTVRAVRVTRDSPIPAIARVVDASALVALVNDLAAAAAAREASALEARRLTLLAAAQESAAIREVEAASAAATADASRERVLRSQLALGWGPGFAALGPDALSSLADALALARTVLVRVDALGAVTTPSGALRLRCGNEWIASGGRDLGLTASMDPRLRSVGRFEGIAAHRSAALVPGAQCAAEIAGPPREGILIPSAAIVRWNALPWVYVKRSQTTFERRAVGDTLAVHDGVLSNDADLLDALLVVAGVESVLAAEFAATLPEAD